MKTGGETEVRVFADLEALSRIAADIFVLLCKDASASKGRFAVALSGGSTPRRFLSLLAGSPYQEQITWSTVHIFWADERCVARENHESNYKLAYETLLSKVPIPEENIHRIKGEMNPEQASRDYEDSLRMFFGTQPIPVFDLIVLGAGEDGHTASLFPGSTAVHERTRIVLPVYVEAPKLNRVTLTLPILDSASYVLFLASGRIKAAVLHEILEDGNPKYYPAGLVRPVHGRLTWLIDRDAGSLLTKQYFHR